MTNQVKTVAITGGASGLGKAMALRYARAGWGVAIADIHEERGAATLQELKDLCGDACYQQVDVRDASAVEAWRDTILERWGHIDVVINNAGIASHGGIAESSLEDWEFTIDINLMGVVRGCKLLPQDWLDVVTLGAHSSV